MILLQARISESKIYSQINLKYTLQKSSSKQTANSLYNHISNQNSGHNLYEAVSLQQENSSLVLVPSTDF